MPDHEKEKEGIPVAEPTVALSVPSPQRITASGLSTSIADAPTHRPIKFRAWDMGAEKPRMLDNVHDGYDFGMWVAFNHFLDDKDFVVMQFTGLLDKNGREIYEGDIVRNGGLICTVDFEAGAFHLVAVETSDEGCWDTLFDLCKQRRIEEVEVIGNIYEKSELLPQ